MAGEQEWGAARALAWLSSGLFEGRLIVTSKRRSRESRPRGVTDTMHYGHLSVPHGPPAGAADAGGGRPRRVPASRRYHCMHPHSRNSFPTHPRGPDALKSPVSGPRAYPREAHGARPRSRRDPGGLRRRAAQTIGSPGRLLLVVLGPVPAARRLRFPPQQPAGRHRGARGGLGWGASSSFGCPATDSALPGSGSGVLGRGACRGAPGPPRSLLRRPPARGPSPGAPHSLRAAVRGSGARGGGGLVGPGVAGGGAAVDRGTDAGAAARPLAMALGGRALRTSPPRCRHCPTRAEPSPSPAPPAGPHHHLQDARRAERVAAAPCCPPLTSPAGGRLLRLYRRLAWRSPGGK